MNELWGNYEEFSEVGVEVYRNFIPNGVLMRVWGELVSGLGVDRDRSGVSDLNFRGVSGVEQLGVTATLGECLEM